MCAGELRLLARAVYHDTMVVQNYVALDGTGRVATGEVFGNKLEGKHVGDVRGEALFGSRASEIASKAIMTTTWERRTVRGRLLYTRRHATASPCWAVSVKLPLLAVVLCIICIFNIRYLYSIRKPRYGGGFVAAYGRHGVDSIVVHLGVFSFLAFVLR